MKGLTLTTLTVIALSTTFLPSPTFAHTTNIYDTQMGCMSCHQGESVQSDQALVKTQDNHHRKNHAKTIKAG